MGCNAGDIQQPGSIAYTLPPLAVFRIRPTLCRRDAWPSTVMIWSIRHLVRAIFRSNKAGTAAAMAFFWLRYLDHLADGRYALDSASGVFFLGRKSRRAIGHGDIIAYYDGLDRSRVARARRAIPARAGVLAPQR
jgi:hypothetical protein